MTIEPSAPAKPALFNWRLYIPKSITVIAQEGYRFADFRADALAGLTVAIVALPLAMAIAIASGTTPDKGLITAIPYLPAAVALYFWSRDASRRGVKAWHIAIPALIGAVTIPSALYMGSPEATIAMITLTACSIFAALPNFWAMPSRFLTGPAAAAGIALINTIGNCAGFAAPYITGLVRDATGVYQLPMFIVGGFLLLSCLLAFSLTGSIREPAAVPAR